MVDNKYQTKEIEKSIADYNYLHKVGIHSLDTLVKFEWTDFNSHDPGITILELLCYALTDLGYRIDFPLPDLLASSASTADSLFPPAQILPTSPITLTDWRKLAIDVSDARNAWVEPVATQTVQLVHDGLNHTLSHQKIAVGGEDVHLKGLYRVLVYDPKLVLSDVRKKLHAYRPLGEDFVEITTIDSQDVAVQAKVEISPVEDAEAVMLTILQQLAYHIAPPVPFNTLRQLLDAGKPIDAIFNGPRLTNGFIDDNQLHAAQRRTELRASDLIQVIMDVPAVKAVRAIQMQTEGDPDRTWTLPLNTDRVAKLKSPTATLPSPSEDVPFETIITLQRNGLDVPVKMSRVKKAFDTWWQTGKRQPDSDAPLTSPKGRDRHVAAYTSIMHHLPETYGVGALGLPASASPERKAKAKQLQAYLLLFDQILANAHAQLAQVGDLFSAAPATPHTYFSQLITDPTLNLDDIMPLTAEDLQKKVTSDGDRQHRFLNHLLARFAESLTDYKLVGNKGAAAQKNADKIVDDKRSFLQNYPDLSHTRGAGRNYLDLKLRNPQNRSGLEKRLQHKMGLDGEQDETFLLVEHILLRPIPEDDTQTVPLLVGKDATSLPADPYSLQLSFVLPEGKGRFSNPAFKDFVIRTIREETPAHLTAHIHWLPKDTFTEFQDMYFNWLEKLRLYWTDEDRRKS